MSANVSGDLMRCRGENSITYQWVLRHHFGIAGFEILFQVAQKRLDRYERAFEVMRNRQTLRITELPANIILPRDRGTLWSLDNPPMFW